MTEQDFVIFVKNECDYYGIKHSLRNTRYVIVDGQACSGFFDDQKKILACAIKRNDYLGILAHEYCHLTQWADKCEPWMRAREIGSYQAWEKHINGESIEMDIHFEAMRDLELDNEKRTVRLIKKLGLPIDVRLYTKKANAYVMLYNYMRITGRWPKPKNSPYTNERILAAMPDKFSLNYTTMPARLEKLYMEEGI
jgi:hypothetical protein